MIAVFMPRLPSEPADPSAGSSHTTRSQTSQGTTLPGRFGLPLHGPDPPATANARESTRHRQGSVPSRSGRPHRERPSQGNAPRGQALHSGPAFRSTRRNPAPRKGPSSDRPAIPPEGEPTVCPRAAHRPFDRFASRREPPFPTCSATLPEGRPAIQIGTERSNAHACV